MSDATIPAPISTVTETAKPTQGSTPESKVDSSAPSKPTTETPKAAASPSVAEPRRSGCPCPICSIYRRTVPDAREKVSVEGIFPQVARPAPGYLSIEDYLKARFEDGFSAASLARDARLRAGREASTSTPGFGPAETQASFRSQSVEDVNRWMAQQMSDLKKNLSETKAPNTSFGLEDDLESGVLNMIAVSLPNGDMKVFSSQQDFSNFVDNLEREEKQRASVPEHIRLFEEEEVARRERALIKFNARQTAKTEKRRAKFLERHATRNFNLENFRNQKK